ncbi:DUF1003 domain-containing protein [Listeria grandensis]|nr:DUF1003 domain-containing protein [Listeria grandensis]
MATIQAPVIMMSQNRQEARGRAQSEIEIRVLHSKNETIL